METFFLNLRRIRKIRGLSQEELADKLNVTRQTISGWETDRCQPDIEMLKMLADVLKVDVSELLYGTKPSGYPRYQKKYLIWFGVTGGIVVAFFIFRMFLFPMADAYTAQHFMVNYRYFSLFRSAANWIFCGWAVRASGGVLICAAPAKGILEMDLFRCGHCCSSTISVDFSRSNAELAASYY